MHLQLFDLNNVSTMHLLLLLLRNPIRSVRFLYTWTVFSFIVILKRILLPHIPQYQSVRQQLHRAYLQSCSAIPGFAHRLPVGEVSEDKAVRVVGTEFVGYVIPGTQHSVLDQLAQKSDRTQCVALYAHGGGYSTGEAKMYINYMTRWVEKAKQAGLDLVFLSVEYPLTDVASHPAQRDAFLNAYQYILDKGISPANIIFMGDSAGGGSCILSGIECLSTDRQLPQPAGSILISPWMDMSMRAFNGGNALAETDYVNANRVIPGLVDKWLKGTGTATTSPDVNPLYRQPGDIEGLNPQLILVGAGEFTLAEGKEWAAMCEKAGVRHRLVCEWGQLHNFALGSAWIDPVVRNRTDSAIVSWMQMCLGW